LHTEPPVHAISTPLAKFDIVRLPAFE
jgi:hypothetical protein